jgi:hypothetical protein
MNLSTRTSRPLGVTFLVSAYTARVVFYLNDTLALLDHRFYRPILDGRGIRDLVIALLSLFVVIGLMGMRRWGRLLAIFVSAVLAVWGGGFYVLDIVMGFWTFVPNGFWANAEILARLGFEIFTVWYLLQPTTREVFRSVQAPQMMSTDEA